MTKPAQAYAAVSPDGKIKLSTLHEDPNIVANTMDAARIVMNYTINSVTIIPTEQYEAMLRAFNYIDALDPESNVHACSPDAVRGLVNRMGEIARTVLAALKEQDHG